MSDWLRGSDLSAGLAEHRQMERERNCNHKWIKKYHKDTIHHDNGYDKWTTEEEYIEIYCSRCGAKQ